MNPGLARLQPYPFERLARLLAGATPPATVAHIPLSIGEPKHSAPPFVVEALVSALGALGTYPSTAGLPEFRRSVAAWLARRFGLGTALEPDTMVLPVNGTREALFAFAQTIVDPRAGSSIALPNPFYQIYEGAAFLAGADPWYLDTPAGNGFVPDLESVPESVWRRCALLYLCSPGNPTGAVLTRDFFKHALELADRHDFVVAADECYSEIYHDESVPPEGLLGACHALGRQHFERAVVFHSLSKRSSLPGLRSGFVAGDPTLIERFRRYRTYHGCALPVHVQRASIAAWDDEQHVIANRALYRQKFAAVVPVLSPSLHVTVPAGGFYLWPAIDGDDEAFARSLFASQNVTVLPGQYLGRGGSSGNPGRGRVRISLVASVEDCLAAAHRIRNFLEHRPP